MRSEGAAKANRVFEKELVALKELNREEDLKKDLHINSTNNHAGLSVQQNAPNPFNEVTLIQCFVPENIHQAQLRIYDMRGHMVKSVAISERGSVNLQIQASSLPAGIYAYLIMGDGQTSETKQMVLTK